MFVSRPRLLNQQKKKRVRTHSFFLSLPQSDKEETDSETDYKKDPSKKRDKRERERARKRSLSPLFFLDILSPTPSLLELLFPFISENSPRFFSLFSFLFCVVIFPTHSREGRANKEEGKKGGEAKASPNGSLPLFITLFSP